MATKKAAEKTAAEKAEVKAPAPAAKKTPVEKPKVYIVNAKKTMRLLIGSEFIAAGMKVPTKRIAPEALDALIKAGTIREVSEERAAESEEEVKAELEAAAKEAERKDAEQAALQAQQEGRT
jgi:hypothetical protein